MSWLEVGLGVRAADPGPEYLPCSAANSGLRPSSSRQPLRPGSRRMLCWSATGSVQAHRPPPGACEAPGKETRQEAAEIRKAPVAVSLAMAQPRFTGKQLRAVWAGSPEQGEASASSSARSASAAGLCPSEAGSSQVRLELWAASLPRGATPPAFTSRVKCRLLQQGAHLS